MAESVGARMGVVIVTCKSAAHVVGALESLGLAASEPPHGPRSAVGATPLVKGVL
jgi:hypothetical protein